jgi:hypothetical protein
VSSAVLFAMIAISQQNTNQDSSLPNIETIKPQEKNPSE